MRRGGGCAGRGRRFRLGVLCCTACFIYPPLTTARHRAQIAGFTVRNDVRAHAVSQLCERGGDSLCCACTLWSCTVDFQTSCFFVFGAGAGRVFLNVGCIKEGHSYITCRTGALIQACKKVLWGWSLFRVHTHCAVMTGEEYVGVKNKKKRSFQKISFPSIHKHRQHTGGESAASPSFIN